MASVHRRPRSPFFHAAFRQGGKLVLRSTGTADRAVARRIADDWEQVGRQAEAGTLIESQTRSVIEGILKRANLDTRGVKPPTVRAFIEDWLESKLAGIAKGSAWSYRKATGSFLSWADRKAGMPLGAILPEDARAFVASLQSANYAPKSISVYGKVLRSAFKQGVTDGLIASNPFGSAIPQPKKAGRKAHQRGTFTQAEVRMLIEAARAVSTDWHTAVMVGAYTGARLRDCCRLRWEEVNLSAGTLLLHQLKTGADIELPLHPELQAHLEGLASKVGDTAIEFVTPTLASCETGGSRGLSIQFSKIMRDAGVTAGKTSEGTRRKQTERGFHALRHTFVSALAAADVSAELRMKLSGHADLKSHSGYTHTETQQLAGAMRKVSFA